YYDSLPLHDALPILPESPPVYPEMEVIEYLNFVGRIKNIPKAGLAKRIDEVMQKCAVTDVRNKEISDSAFLHHFVEALRLTGFGDLKSTRLNSSHLG